jgi:selenocysteine lyase/cysteine desulfurase
MGVELHRADVSGDDPESALLALMDERTRLLTVSSVQFGTGVRMDLNRLGEACRERGVLFCVDAIQSLGAVQFDAQAAHADFVVADGHKWMSGPEGIALFYSTEQARDQLRLSQYGWHMVEAMGDFDLVEWSPAKSARRFEPGSPNMLGISALNASLSLFEEIGMDRVEKQLLERSRLLMDQISEHDQLELVTPASSGRYAGIVTFRHRELDNNGHAALYRRLMAADIICAHRAGGIRFSPHFYSDVKQFEAVWETVFSQPV